MISAWTDGAARGNPGPAAIAFHIQGLRNEAINFGQTIGEATNNQAEYRALIACLRYLLDSGISNQSISLHCDSELMVKQLNGEYRVKNEQILGLFRQAEELIRRLTNKSNLVDLQAVGREQNRQADRLANLALDGSPTDASPTSPSA